MRRAGGSRRSGGRAAACVLASWLLVTGAAAQDADSLAAEATEEGPAPSAETPAADTADPAATADSVAPVDAKPALPDLGPNVIVIGGDDDSAAAPDSSQTQWPAYRPSAAMTALRDFRLERSVDVERSAFGDPDNPIEPLGLLSLADHLRLSPGVRTRELSQGPTIETFGLWGSGSGRSSLQWRGASLPLPGTSGPHTNEIAMSEIRGFSILRGGAAALYGPEAAAGALVLDTSSPLPDAPSTRVTVDEGTDDLTRASATFARRFGPHWGAFVNAETRVFEGFFVGTKASDRTLSATVVNRLPAGWELASTWRRFEADGRHGGFESALERDVTSERHDGRIEAYRPWRDDRGTLIGLNYTSARVENGLGGESADERHFVIPQLQVTSDLPDFAGLHWVARTEGSRSRVTTRSSGEVATNWRGASALRVTAGEGSTRFTVTGRADGEEGRRTAWQGRAEGQWRVGDFGVFGHASHSERWPDRGAALGGVNERHLGGGVGLRFQRSAFGLRAVAWANEIRDFRRDPTFEKVRAHAPVLDAPVGTAELRGTTIGGETAPFGIPGAGWLGSFLLRTSATWQSAENATFGTRLPGRPEFSWTGEGYVERRFFSGELLARARGRLTHWADRVDDAGEPVVDLWLTDVGLEGEIGDAVFFFRFHDLPARADEVEPGVRFPGFSRFYGISWRFLN